MEGAEERSRWGRAPDGASECRLCRRGPRERVSLCSSGPVPGGSAQGGDLFPDPGLAGETSALTPESLKITRSYTSLGDVRTEVLALGC